MEQTSGVFPPLRKIEAGVLNVTYAEIGPAGGPPVILFHGWPYDIHAFVDVAPLLAAQGYRVIIPYLRGYGATRFLSADTMRNGQPAALATDAMDLMDALKIERPVLAGFDWGARTADIVAALWPKRVRGLVAVSGYLIGSQAAGKQPLPPAIRVPVVVPILLRNRARAARLREEQQGLRQADLATGIAKVDVRRRDVRTIRGRVR